MKKLFSVIFIFLIIFSTACSIAENEQYNFNIKKAFDDYNVIGGTFVVYHNGEKLIAYNYGYADKRNKVLVDDNTKLKIASISKMVSNFGVMKLVEKGLLDLDKDISDYLGYKIRNPKYLQTPITARMILNHTSSIQDSSLYTYKKAPLSKIIGESRISDSAFTSSKPGKKYKYSNFAFGILGSIVENITSSTMQDYMTNEIFKPLSIDAAYSIDGLKEKNVASRYVDNRTVENTAILETQLLNKNPDPENNYNTVAGKLMISADDLSKLLQILIFGGQYKGIRILDKNSVLDMLQSYDANMKDVTKYSMALERRDDIVDGYKLYGHQGKYYSSYCDAYFDPVNQISLVLLTNGQRISRTNGVNGLAKRLFTMTYDLIINNKEFIVEE